MAKKSDNTMMYTALGIATAAGAYIYFKNPEVSHEAKARKDELEKKARVEMDKAKSRAGDMVQKGEGKVEQMKVRHVLINKRAKSEFPLGRY